jgi:hypothetical protein
MVTTQILNDNSGVVPEVLSEGPGWIVIHANDDGTAGAVVGYSAVASGYNVDVFVEIAQSKP